MKPPRVAIVLAFGMVQATLAEKQETAFELPAALKSDAPELPAQQNQLLRFLELPPTTPDLIKRTREALERLDKGERVEDGELLDELRKWHQLGRETLKPPLSFEPNQQLFPVSLFRLFKGGELLAKLVLMERDYGKADEILEDLLRWSRMLRNAQPTMAHWVTARFAWKLAFDAMLQDFGKHPDPAKRLDLIREKFRQNPIESAELVETLKAEARWSVTQGGIRGMLERNELTVMGTLFLKPPFNDLKSDDLASLPYDIEADRRRDVADTLAKLAALKRNAPLLEWSGLQSHAVERTFEDYKRRPNGLGDLFYEQSDPSLRTGFWNSALSNRPLLEGCLRWLEAERDGRVVREELFRDLLDPMDGKPLSIDFQQRTIRTRGANRKVDPPDPNGLPMPSGGFHMNGDDGVIVVPKWQGAAKTGH